MAEPVIHMTLVAVGKDGVGFGRFLELVFRFLASGIGGRDGT